jgi:hypothetical protein
MSKMAATLSKRHRHSKEALVTHERGNGLEARHSEGGRLACE